VFESGGKHGIVESAEPFKDGTTNEKMWNYVVRFQNKTELVTFQMPSSSIQFFIDSSPCPCLQNQQFKLATFKGTVEETQICWQKSLFLGKEMMAICFARL
jgi:hypothetical protein